MAETTKFSGISLSQWRQFKDVQIDLHARMTILTGRNGTGKTTVLNLLAKHGKFSSPLLGSPIQARDSLGRYLPGRWDNNIPLSASIGSIRYRNGVSAEIAIPESGAVGFEPIITNRQVVHVLNIGSHRKLPKYKPVEKIPTRPVTGKIALDEYQNEFWADISRIPPLTRMKESLISMAVFGLGNSIVASNSESFDIFEDFQSRLKQIIPSNIGFRRLVVQVPDVIIQSDSGNFLIDASSGGLMSIIDMAWEVTLFARQHPECVIIIDEPENHLHPSMQRELLPALVSAFPEAQFIIATHSPFMVNSVRDAAVYAFDIERDQQKAAIAEDLSGMVNSVITVPVPMADRTSSDEIMRKVLGVPVTAPIWAEQALNRIVAQIGQAGMTAETIRSVREQLVALGLEEFLPQAISDAAVKNAPN